MRIEFACSKRRIKMANQGYTPEVLAKMADKHVQLNDIVIIPPEISSEKNGEAKCIRKFKNFYDFEILKTGLTVSIQLADILNLEIKTKSGFKPKNENEIMNEIIDNLKSV